MIVKLQEYMDDDLESLKWNHEPRSVGITNTCLHGKLLPLVDFEVYPLVAIVKVYIEEFHEWYPEDYKHDNVYIRVAQRNFVDSVTRQRLDVNSLITSTQLVWDPGAGGISFNCRLLEG